MKAQTENSLNVKFYTTEASLHWLVTQFESIRSNDSNQILTDKFIPRPDAALVFHFKNTPTIKTPVEAKLKDFFVAPVVAHPTQMDMRGALDGFIVVCKASVLSKIFSLDMQEKSQLCIDLPEELFAPLWEKLKCLSTDEDRINCFTNFIQNIIREPYKPDFIDLIYDNIVSNIAAFSLEKIRYSGLHSISSMQRKFNTRVGVSMKKLMRIARVNFIFNAMQNLPDFDTQKLMFDGNYYDQAHFIKDFKELTGETPKQFFKNNSELCRIISGIFKAEMPI